MTDPTSLIGYTTRPYEHQLDWKQAVTYAIGIGAKRDELDYLHEKRGPKVFPTFAVIPSFEPMIEVVAKVGGGFENLVHGGHSVIVHRPIPAEGTLVTTGRLDAVYDLKRLAQVIASTRTYLGDELLVECTWNIILFDRGGFGGPRPPRQERVAPEEGAVPDFESRQSISPEQAIIYRLSGDTNPLHIDHEFAKKLGFDAGPILHGLCTFGFAVRALLGAAADADADRLVSFHTQFKKPVWPGDELVTKGYRLADGRWALNVGVTGREEPVLGNTWAKLR